MAETFPMQEVDPNMVGPDERANVYRSLEIRVAIQQAKALQEIANALNKLAHAKNTETMLKAQNKI